MVERDLDYEGRPELHKERALVEPDVVEVLSPAAAPDERDPAIEGSKKLFVNLGRTFLKGEKLKEGLSLMKLAQYIPIAEDADLVYRAAIRLDDAESNNGRIITYRLFQRCVSVLADRQWSMRRVYDDPIIPPDSQSSSKKAVLEYEHGGEDLDSFIKAFLTGEGIAGALLVALSISPFQNLIFQSLSGEESGAKAVATAQIPVGIAVLLELGIKAWRIIKLLKQANMSTPEVESIVNELDTNVGYRKEVLDNAGFEYDKFLESQEVQDSRTIVSYCNSYIASYTGEDVDTYDHWVAYSQVAARQNLVRGALDSATRYSAEFAVVFNEQTSDGRFEPQANLSNVIASHFNELEVSSNDTYNEILNSFLYQVTDADMCCLVEIFGSMDTSSLKLLASILRILSLDLKAELSRLMDYTLNLLSNLSAAAIYDLTSRMDFLTNKLGIKILGVFSDIEERYGAGLEHCPSFFDIGIAVNLAVDALRRKIEIALMDVLSSLDKLGTPLDLSWRVPAERRYLLAIAKILDTLATKIDAAEICNRGHDAERNKIVLEDAKDSAAVEIIQGLLEGGPPSIQISDADIKKYFPDLSPSRSPRFGFDYGPRTIFPRETSRRETALNTCGHKIQPSEMEEIRSAMQQALTQAFRRDDG